MPELKGREKDEQEMALLLLLLFASEDMEFWYSGYHTPQWFDEKLKKLGLNDRLSGMSRRVQDAMMKELRYQVSRGTVDARVRQLTEFYRHELAYRMSRVHAEWVDEQEAAARARDIATRTGRVPEDEIERKPLDIYPESFAKREAASGITDWVSATEMATAVVVEKTHDVKLEAIWRTEPGACPICEPMNGTTRAVWSKQFPKGPKAHPNCLAPGTHLSLPYGLRDSMKSHYEGPMHDLCIGGQYFLSVTAGHPIPTTRGIVGAGDLKSGDAVYMVDAGESQEFEASALHRSVSGDPRARLVSVVPDSSMLHGEGGRVHGEIEIASLYGLRCDHDAYDPDESLRSVLGACGINHRIVGVTFNSVRHYAGDVYDFSAQSHPFYVASGILVSNCRCHLSWHEVLGG